MKPGLGIIAVILLLSLLNPLQYAVLKFFPPGGLEFNGFGDDDALIITSIKYVEFGFKSPWVLETDRINGAALERSVFSNPGNGPVYLMALLNPFYLLGLDPLLIFVAYKFLAAVFALFMVFYLLEALIKDKKLQKTAFFVFALSAGFGGIIYLFTSSLGLFGFGIGAYKILDFYQSFPFGLAALSIILFTRKKYLYSSIFLALTVLFYPAYAIGTLLTFVVYDAVFRSRSLCTKNLASILLLPAVAGLVWVYSYIKQPYFFEVYSYIVEKAVVNVVLSVLLGLGLPLLFILYGTLKGKDLSWTIKNKLHLFLVWAVGVILISISQVSQSRWLDSVPVPDLIKIFVLSAEPYSLVLDAVFLLIVAVAIRDVYRSKIDEKYRFALIWFLAMLFVIAFPTKISGLVQPKIVSMLALPAAILAAYGIAKFSPARKINVNKIVLIIFLVSIPSLFFFYSFNQSLARSFYGADGTLQPNTFYYTQDDRSVLNYLKPLEPGVVIASAETSAYVPDYANKQATPWLYGKYYKIRSELFLLNKMKEEDAAKFFSGRNRDEQLAIANKYNIKYVFYGTFEKQEYGAFQAPDFLKLVYTKGGTELYVVF